MPGDQNSGGGTGAGVDPGQPGATSGISSGLTSGNPPLHSGKQPEVFIAAISGKADPSRAVTLTRITLDGTNLYATANELGPNYVFRLPRDGGSPTILYETPFRELLAGLTTDGTQVYVSNYPKLMAVPVAGGQASVAHPDGCYDSLVAHAASLFWLCQKDVLSKPKAGGAPATLHTAADYLRDLAIDDDRLFIASMRAIWTMGHGGGALTEFGRTEYALLALTVDAAHVYWSDEGGGNPRLLRAPKAGGPSEVLFQVPFGDPQAPHKSLAIDDAHVYWSTPAGKVMRLKK